MKLKQFTIAAGLVIVFSAGTIVGANADSIYEKITAFKDNSISFMVHGKAFIPQDSNGNNIAPITYNDTTYLPLRAISNAVGLPIIWDQSTRTASIGYSSVQLNNFSAYSFASIEISGGWTPTYLTNEKKRYSNSYMGVDFEIKQLNGEAFDDVVEMERSSISKYGVNIQEKKIKISEQSGNQIEYESYSNGKRESYSKKVYLASNNSDEYYVIYTFVSANKYEDAKATVDTIINSFRKQR